jgi:hypothetical protein
MYSCMKMEKRGLLKLFQEWGEGDKEEWWRGVNSTRTYCKNFCKCHNVPSVHNKKQRNLRKTVLPSFLRSGRVARVCSLVRNSLSGMLWPADEQGREWTASLVSAFYQTSAN